MANLAINGGEKVRSTNFPQYNTIGPQEHNAVKRVLNTGVLSDFLGRWHENFYGGFEVQALEEEWKKYFGVKHAIAVNSATSALYCAVGATEIEPGDQVIVSPYTMTASAIAPLVYNAIPVFADIEEEYFCLDPKSVEEKITDRTKAIIVVDIFGQPYNADAINKIARKYNLIVIEDSAQAPGALYHKKYAGTLGDIGVYSLNKHKHIQSGEGGIIVTDSDELAERMRLIRNHAEAVISDFKGTNLINMIGFNYRMTELEAAISREQLSKLDNLLITRRRNVCYLSEKLSSVPCIDVAKERCNSKHAYYLQILKFNSEVIGVHRNEFINAVKAELCPIGGRIKEGIGLESGYIEPLYMQPMYQKKIAYGSKGFPWNYTEYGRHLSYAKGICPVSEKMYEDTLITNELIHTGMSYSDLDDVAEAFLKVWKHRDELQKISVFNRKKSYSSSSL